MSIIIPFVFISIRLIATECRFILHIYIVILEYDHIML